MDIIEEVVVDIILHVDITDEVMVDMLLHEDMVVLIFLQTDAIPLFQDILLSHGDSSLGQAVTHHEAPDLQLAIQFMTHPGRA